MVSEKRLCASYIDKEYQKDCFSSLYGALGGDLIGSVYEGYGCCVDSLDFPLFKNGCRLTDDSILTLATADKLLHGGDYTTSYRKWAQLHLENMK